MEKKIQILFLLFAVACPMLLPNPNGVVESLGLEKSDRKVLTTGAFPGLILMFQLFGSFCPKLGGHWFLVSLIPCLVGCLCLNVNVHEVLPAERTRIIYFAVTLIQSCLQGAIGNKFWTAYATLGSEAQPSAQSAQAIDPVKVFNSGGALINFLLPLISATLFGTQFGPTRTLWLFFGVSFLSVVVYLIDYCRSTPTQTVESKPSPGAVPASKEVDKTRSIWEKVCLCVLAAHMCIECTGMIENVAAGPKIECEEYAILAHCHSRFPAADGLTMLFQAVVGPVFCAVTRGMVGESNPNQVPVQTFRFTASRFVLSNLLLLLWMTLQRYLLTVGGGYYYLQLLGIPIYLILRVVVLVLWSSLTNLLMSEIKGEELVVWKCCLVKLLNAVLVYLLPKLVPLVGGDRNTELVLVGAMSLLWAGVGFASMTKKFQDTLRGLSPPSREGAGDGEGADDIEMAKI